MQDSHQITPIGYARTPFKEKFGIPRQPRLAQFSSQIHLTGECNQPTLVADLEQHSHIWVLFLFHENLDKGWKASVRPPRLGGNQKTGVLATRSTFRPNGIGMSAVKLKSVNTTGQQVVIEVESLDLVDGTPIVDIKPYIPYSDCIIDAQSQMASDAPENTLEVVFSDTAQLQVSELLPQYPQLDSLVQQVLQQDPRPSYKKQKADDKVYGIRLYDINIRWQVCQQQIVVIDLTKEASV